MKVCGTTKGTGTAVQDARIVHPFAPVYDGNSRILILGTMPSPVSRENGFYYGHGQNRFWPVLAAVFSEPVPETVKQKRALVLRHGIALWDVLRSCRISGANDASIKEPVANDLRIFPHIRRIYTTGKTAWKLYNDLCFPLTNIPAVCLPSTSAANRGRWPLEKLIEAYKVIAK